MVKEAKLSKEIVVTVTNKIGILADMSRLLADAGINIDAVAGYAVGNEARIMLVTPDDARAEETLKKANYTSIKLNDCIVVDLENKPGALKDITAKMASEMLDIKQIYGSACTAGCPAKIIISTTDNQKAIAAFKK
ncbi:MAG: ACT domain-containing protein [Candidatus Omnitrophota bacterium]